MLPGLVLLKKADVLPRMKVALFRESECTPARDREGKPLTLIALIGGIPNRKKFYPVNGISSSPGASIVGTSFENLGPDTWFAPVETFSPVAAPANTEYVAFIGGELRTQPQCGGVELFNLESRNSPLVR